MDILVSTSYLAPVSYFSALNAASTVFIEHQEHYVKQTFRNRCVIAGPDGPLPLTVPVVKPQDPHCPICEIRISDHGNWRHLHWNALKSAYGQSPFFEYYEDDFRPFYEPDWEYLVDYNRDLLQCVCRLIDIQPSLRVTEAYESSPSDVTDLRFPAVFPYSPKPYYQVFSQREGFLPDLSIVDMLFCMGPESILYL